MEKFGLKDPMFVVMSNELDVFSSQIQNRPFEAITCLCYEEGKCHVIAQFVSFHFSLFISDEDMTEIINVVKGSSADIIVFAGAHPTRLIKLLDQETPVFRLPQVTIMNIPNPNVRLRLDTSIVQIEENGASDAYLLTESYSVKNGSAKINVYGYWSKNEGLSVKDPNLNERRRNLGGIQLRDAIMPYAKLTKIYLDSDGNIKSTGGVYQGCIFFI